MRLKIKDFIFFSLSQGGIAEGEMERDRDWPVVLLSKSGFNGLDQRSVLLRIYFLLEMTNARSRN